VLAPPVGYSSWGGSPGHGGCFAFCQTRGWRIAKKSWRNKGLFPSWLLRGAEGKSGGFWRLKTLGAEGQEDVGPHVVSVLVLAGRQKPSTQTRTGPTYVFRHLGST